MSNNNGLVNIIVTVVVVGAAIYAASIIFSPAKKAAKGIGKASKYGKKSVPQGTAPVVNNGRVI